MNLKEKKNQNFIDKIKNFRISLSFSVLIIIVFISVSYFITKEIESSQTKGGIAESGKSDLNIRRISGFKFTRPLLSAKPSQESALYVSIKEKAAKVISEYKNLGVISTGSVYMRDFDKSDWFCINDLEKYIPGSLLKIPVLITYLLMEEENPGVLNRKIAFDKSYGGIVKANIVTKSIKFGNSYTVQELLDYMIVNSDNNANWLLNINMDNSRFYKVFTDLSMETPTDNTDVFPLNVRECSRFLEILVNSTYLNVKNSEYALNLLTQTDFNDGIIKGIQDKEVLVAHKFGESGNDIYKQLHETAVFYINGKPYLLTIMTKGNKNIPLEKLAEVLQKISNVVYTGLKKTN